MNIIPLRSVSMSRLRICYLKTSSKIKENFIKPIPININTNKVSIYTDAIAPKQITILPQAIDHHYDLSRNTRS